MPSKNINFTVSRNDYLCTMQNFNPLEFPHSLLHNMLSKIMVVEDSETTGYGITMMLKKELGIREVVFCQYCDDAYLKLQKAVSINNPFDLIITDLSFRPDHRPNQIKSGQKLIEKVRKIDSRLKIIVFSVDIKSTLLHKLKKEEKVSGFVLKGRNALTDLQLAIQKVKIGKSFMSESLQKDSKTTSFIEVSTYEIQLLDLLSQGLSQHEISTELKLRNINPSGLSSIEKRLNRLKDNFQVKSTIQLVAQAKDLGII